MLDAHARTANVLRPDAQMAALPVQCANVMDVDASTYVAVVSSSIAQSSV